jgi:hypothetical protein
MVCAVGQRLRTFVIMRGWNLMNTRQRVALVVFGVGILVNLAGLLANGGASLLLRIVSIPLFTTGGWVTFSKSGRRWATGRNQEG